MGRYIRVISETGGLSATILDATSIVQKMEEYHKTSATASAALGRVLTATSLLGSELKGEEDSLTVRVAGGGPIGTLVSVSDSRGNVKGYCSHPEADLPARSIDGKLDVGGIVGRNGTLGVVMDLGLKEPYSGQVPLVSGEIAEDITSYCANSQQVPSACALGVLVERDLSIRCAGGYLLRVLPGALESDLVCAEQNIANMPPITEMLQNGVTLEEIAEKLMERLSPQVLSESSAEYICDCSRERMYRGLLSISKSDLKEIIESDEQIETVCGFCNKKYHFAPEELVKNLAKTLD